MGGPGPTQYPGSSPHLQPLLPRTAVLHIKLNNGGAILISIIIFIIIIFNSCTCVLLNHTSTQDINLNNSTTNYSATHTPR